MFNYQTFPRRKHERGTFQFLISDHAVEEKHQTISKKRLRFFLKIKLNVQTFPLESHVANHRQACGDLRECSAHVEFKAPELEKNGEHLVDSVNCTNSTLQEAIGLVRANTINMREDFEAESISLIEVDSYCR